MLRQHEDGRKGKLQMSGLHHSSRRTGARWRPVIARDDSGARRWIEEIGKIGTEREGMRDSTLNVK